MGLTITSRNARFQQWQALLTNRTKRHRAGEFIVQGVRPISLAVQHGWEIRALLHRHGGALSKWAVELLDTVDTTHVAMADELLAELGEQEETPELVAVVAQRADDPKRIAPGLVVVFDRPVSPGNVGMLIRSADAFGATGVVVTGHSADIYDPRAVRASTGSLFALPVVRLDRYQTKGFVIGLDEHGSLELADVDLRGPTTLVVGNETHGLSANWRDACDVLARIPIGGAASSLNAAAAGSIALYEVARQRSIQG
ncbi:TrmH family RNA methyltransferase [Allorhizocola rhizosphaerae]|uniref:TrmH family RNA methyltransferase n=1 Tax=Allorhizocola rhizosphaerae TaxID=1872709 RepID=UPI000E3CA369|nr:TrmH family RNA methyltransferase [Allorhizocola rhizosphaerae]